MATLNLRGGPGSGPQGGSHADEIEGTQAEADAEVKKAFGLVASIKKQIAAKIAESPDGKVKALEERFAAAQAKTADLKSKIDASNERIAALKAQLKPKKK